MSDVIHINRSRALIEHKAFVAGVRAAADLAELQLVLAEPDVAEAALRFAEFLRRNAYRLADQEIRNEH
jgi:hypothetical protein